MNSFFFIFYIFIYIYYMEGSKLIFLEKLKKKPQRACYEKKEGWNLHIDSFFFAIFFRTVCIKRCMYGSWGIQFYPNQPTLSRKITFFRPRGWERDLESTYWSYDISQYRGWKQRSVFFYKFSWRMGTTRNSYLWYYAICATRGTYNMPGISRFNGIFYPGRRNNYQTSSIPSRLAPMSFLFDRKKQTMPSPYEIWILSNNSMALRIRYEKILYCFFFFKTLDYVSKEKYEIKGISDFILSIGGPFQRHKLFVFTSEGS